MRLCPLCDQPANSKHHIKPQTQGGTDDARNLVWLCQPCHDEVEGIEFTPELMMRLRRGKLSAKTISHEEYWWLHKDNGQLFIGIMLPGRKELIYYNIFFPYDSQFALAPVKAAGNDANQLLDEHEPMGQQINHYVDMSEFFVPTVKKRRGRPYKVITAEERLVLETGGQSLAEKAKLLGVSEKTIQRRLKELQEVYRIK